MRAPDTPTSWPRNAENEPASTATVSNAGVDPEGWGEAPLDFGVGIVEVCPAGLFA